MGYSYYGNGPQCYSSISDEQLVTYYSYSYGDNSWKKGTPTTRPWTKATVVKGDGIPIFWQKSDSAVLVRASAITMSSQASTVSMPGSTSVDPSKSPTATGTPTPSPDGLSTGAKIGLGVGIPVAIIALLAIGFLLWRKRREPAVDANDTVHDPDHKTEYKGAPAAPGYAPRGYGAELHGEGSQLQPQYYEIQASPEGYYNRHELPSVAHQ
jgi:hypothetical protein